MNRPVSPMGIIVLLSLSLGMVAPARSASVPAQNLDPASATIRLDSTFQSDAWLVYTYDIGADGRVLNAAIQSSNGVLEVEQAVLQQVAAMRFSPATRNDAPIQVSAGPMVYTWILDKPRELSPRFSDLYRQAWGFYAEQNYDAASGIAEQLKNYPGRNAQEAVKYQLLAASLASRRQDDSAELKSLNRVVKFQDLALSNSFRNTYLPQDQYQKVLKRIMELQLGRNMLADAEHTLESIQSLGGDAAIASEAGDRFRQVELASRSLDDLATAGELPALYPGGPGTLKIRLSRDRFSLSDISGQVSSVFLVCAESEKQLFYPAKAPWSIPPGWSQCLIEVSGKGGTGVVLHQYGSGG